VFAKNLENSGAVEIQQGGAIIFPGRPKQEFHGIKWRWVSEVVTTRLNEQA
jgi:hypothetical protein